MPSTVQWYCSTDADRWDEKHVLPSNTSRDPDLKVTDITAQTWEGVGGCFNEMGWDCLTKLGSADRNALLDSLFSPSSGCRFSICRIPIGASDYAMNWYSHNESGNDLSMKRFSIERDEQFLLPFISSALSRRSDLRLFASPWSPPTPLKNPPVYNFGKLKSETPVLDAYADYLVRFVQAYAEKGVTINQLHVQNEPSADQKFPSCLWTGEELRVFIRNHLGPAFERAGLDCELWLGTINSDDYNAFANIVLSDPEARKYLSGVGYQWAGKHAMQRTREAWPSLRLMQTENECGDGSNSWSYAMYVFDLMRHYIGNGAVAYIYWNMILPPGGVSTWGWKQNAMITIDNGITFNPEYYIMRHLGQFVDVGAKRLILEGGLSGNAFAFQNPDGRQVVLAANTLEKPRLVRIEGRQLKLEVEIPARSVNTFIS